MDAADIRARIDHLGLPLGQYAVHSSASLVLRGILSEAGDVDVVCRGPAWRQALALVESGAARLEAGDVDQQVLVGDDVELYDGWLGQDIDELIAKAELVEGLPCVRLAAVVAMKKQLDRPKDREHLARIDAYLAREGAARG